jgi:hypothetical protein
MNEQMIYDAIIKNPMLKQPLKVMEKLKDSASSYIQSKTQDFDSPASPPLIETGLLSDEKSAVRVFVDLEQPNDSNEAPVDFQPVRIKEEFPVSHPSPSYSVQRKISNLKSG